MEVFKAHKEKLTEAKRLGLEIAGKTLTEYGIDKMEGTIISSLTITPARTKQKQTIRVLDPDKVMELGYVTFSVDTKAIEASLADSEENTQELMEYIEVKQSTETTAPKLKINKRRSPSYTIEPLANAA